MTARVAGPGEAMSERLAASGADLRVAGPGRIKTLSADKQRADIEPLVKRGYEDETGTRQAPVPPVICNVPVMHPAAPAFAALKAYLDQLELAFNGLQAQALAWSVVRPSVPAGADLVVPVEVGDTGLLVFADDSLDIWLSKGGLVDPLDDRHHALSDAVFIPGLRPFSNPISVPP
jgi:hypothetical protein